MHDSNNPSDPFVEVGSTNEARACLTVITAQAGTKEIDIPADGIALEDLEIYDNNFSYVVKGQAVAPDHVFYPGDTVHAAKHHSNG